MKEREREVTLLVFPTELYYRRSAGIKFFEFDPLPKLQDGCHPRFRFVEVS